MKSMSTDSSFSGYELAGPSGRAKSRSIGSESSTGQRDMIRVVLLLTTVALSCLLVYKSVDKPLQVMLPQWKTNWYSQNQTSLKPVQLKKLVSELERVLMNAAMEDNTVIITALNNAWTAPNSTFELFLESFQTGLGTKRLLKHVIAVCLDSKAYDRCKQVHPHCYLINATDSDELSGKNRFMSPGYLKLIWRRMDLLKEVLSLGYNFLFTDADILWLRDPFPRFFSDADFQISCDDYNGKPSDKNNNVNSGFTYVKANNKTLTFYKYWCDSSKRFPKRHDQHVFNSIKNEPFIAELGITMRFMDTVYFGGFCQPSRDINVVNTMHANCCIGLDNKVKNLKAALEDWKQYLLVWLLEVHWKKDLDSAKSDTKERLDADEYTTTEQSYHDRRTENSQSRWKRPDTNWVKINRLIGWRDFRFKDFYFKDCREFGFTNFRFRDFCC